MGDTKSLGRKIGGGIGILLRLAWMLGVLYMLMLINAPRELVCADPGEGIMVCRSSIAPPRSEPMLFPAPERERAPSSEPEHEPSESPRRRL